jgi:putative salt-induced outer membrane protein YdiY
MRFIVVAAAMAAFVPCVLAQDTITLANGDVLKGAVKSMDSGKLVFSSPSLGDIEVPIANINNITTQGPVDLLTVGGELYKRRISGLESRVLKLDGDVPPIALDSLSRINPPLAEAPKWVGAMKMAALFADGNTERRAVNASFDATRRSEIDRFTFDAAWDYGQDRQPSTGDWNLTQRRVGGGLKYDYFLTKRSYALVTSRVLGDTLADLRLRFTGGAGVGYTVVENDSTSFVTEAGLSYFNENYRSDAPSTDFIAARVAYRLSHALSATTRLIHAVEAYPSLEKADDIYLQARVEVVTSLTESMIASLSWIMDYDNTPAPGRERADHRVLLSVGWSF